MAVKTDALDIVTLIVAIYAALVATGALVFQVISWWHTWQTRVSVELRRMTMHDPATGSEQPAIVFALINHSGHDVKVTHVGLKPLRKGGNSIWIPQPLGAPGPGSFTVSARDGVTVWIRPDELKDPDPSHRTRAVIRTSDGRDFDSKRVKVADLLE